MSARAGVMGWPVAHSLSPRLHGYWLAQYGIDGAYLPLEVRPEELAREIGALREKGFRGCNLTIPHKEAVLPLLDHVSDEARRIGAVNTLVVDAQGKLHGTNSDAYGFAQNIAPHLGAHKRKAVLLGAGGAARAVCHALVELGFGEVVIVNRTQEKAEALAAVFAGSAQAAGWERRSEALSGCDLLVNTTSLGMAGKDALDIDLERLDAQAVVTDIVYTPLHPPLLQAAQARGHTVVDGLGMLLHQAVPGFEAWFGVRPEVTEELRAYVLQAAT